MRIDISLFFHKLAFHSLTKLVLLTGLLQACSEPVDQAHPPIKRLAADIAQFQNPSPDFALTFPEAHAPKKTFRQEWWYLTANLTTDKGDDIATQWTLFRLAIEDKHWYFAHAALADTNRHSTAFRDGREELGTVQIQSTPFHAQIADWQWRATAEHLPPELLPAELSYGTRPLEPDSSPAKRVRPSDWHVKLNLNTEAPFFLQGKQGFSRKHHQFDIASHYYSQPFIEVTGTILWQGKWQRVKGNAWFDREWGSQMLADDQEGWDWFSLRLDQDTVLMVYRIRSSKEDFLYASVMSRNGDMQTLGGSDIQVSTERTGGRYPLAFRLTIPGQGIDVRVEVINDQQIMRMGIEYFEGMVRFDGSHTGLGFLEMTGYE